MLENERFTKLQTGKSVRLGLYGILQQKACITDLGMR